MLIFNYIRLFISIGLFMFILVECELTVNNIKDDKNMNFNDNFCNTTINYINSNYICGITEKQNIFFDDAQSKESELKIKKFNENNIEVNSTLTKNDIHIKVALCAIGKNENLYVREWVEYYKNIGVNKIFIYDNNEIDGERFEEVINDYILNGFVEIINRRGIIKSVKSINIGMSTQGQAYRDCYYNNYNKYDWIFFFDIDEFIVIDYKYDNIFKFLNDFKKYDGIKVQWRMYGDNGNLHYENKPVIERFDSKNNVGYDRHIKTILKCKKYDFELYFSAHSILSKIPVIVNVIKKRLINPYFDNTNSKPYENLPVYLNHYYSKSTEEYIKRKYMKTSASVGIHKKHWNFSLISIKNRYFKYNNITKEKVEMFNSLKKKI